MSRVTVLVLASLLLLPTPAWGQPAEIEKLIAKLEDEGCEVRGARWQARV